MPRTVAGARVRACAFIHCVGACNVMRTHVLRICNAFLQALEHKHTRTEYHVFAHTIRMMHGYVYAPSIVAFNMTRAVPRLDTFRTRAK